MSCPSLTLICYSRFFLPSECIPASLFHTADSISHVKPQLQWSMVGMTDKKLYADGKHVIFHPRLIFFLCVIKPLFPETVSARHSNYPIGTVTRSIKPQTFNHSCRICSPLLNAPQQQELPSLLFSSGGCHIWHLQHFRIFGPPTPLSVRLESHREFS